MAQGEGNQGTDSPAHDTGTRKGEELYSTYGEPGRHRSGKTGADRPAGYSNARSSTGINPDDREPIDPRMPHIPPA